MAYRSEDDALDFRIETEAEENALLTEELAQLDTRLAKEASDNRSLFFQNCPPPLVWHSSRKGLVFVSLFAAFFLVPLFAGIFLGHGLGGVWDGYHIGRGGSVLLFIIMSLFFAPLIFAFGRSTKLDWSQDQLGIAKWWRMQRQSWSDVEALKLDGSGYIELRVRIDGTWNTYSLGTVAPNDETKIRAWVDWLTEATRAHDDQS